MKKLIFRVPVNGGTITQIPKTAAFTECCDNGTIWTYTTAETMFAPRLSRPAVVQSDRYLYSLDVDALRRNANRLGIRID